MKKIYFTVDSDLYVRFMLAHEKFLRENYPNGGGPDFMTFVGLCAELSLICLETEVASVGGIYGLS